MQLSRRLQKIEEMVSGSYDHIWDCCCDHGLLGFNLLKKGRATELHFVDIVPELLIQIEDKLNKHWQGNKHSWHTHCLDLAQDVANLPLAAYSKKPKKDKHLIIIAGVGGKLMIKMMQPLLPLCDSFNVQFILCPVHHNYLLRTFLINNKFALFREHLLFENNRAYEILHIATSAALPIAQVGSSMWDFKDPLHLDYLDKTINHYLRIANNPKMEVATIIEDYQGLLSDANDR